MTDRKSLSHLSDKECWKTFKKEITLCGFLFSKKHVALYMYEPLNKKITLCGIFFSFLEKCGIICINHRTFVKTN